jgi:Fe2+ or Zn2+ uptake regulation protein
MNTPNKEELEKAFVAFESHDFKVNTVICTVCGRIVNIHEKQKPCKHLKELAKSMADPSNPKK